MFKVTAKSRKTGKIHESHWYETVALLAEVKKQAAANPTLTDTTVVSDDPESVLTKLNQIGEMAEIISGASAGVDKFFTAEEISTIASLHEGLTAVCNAVTDRVK